MDEEGQVDEALHRIRELTDQIDALRAQYLAAIRPLADERVRLMRELRDEKGLGLRELAREVGLSLGRVQEILAGPPESP